MSEDVKPRLVNLQCEKGKKLGIIKVFSFDVSNKETIRCGDTIIFIELEPTLQLMKEMGEKLQILHELVGSLSLSPNPESNTISMEITHDVLEKYRKFLEVIQK